MTENSDGNAPEPAHYLMGGGPSAVVGAVSTIFALIILAFAISEIKMAGANRPSLSIIAGTEAAADLPVLTAGEKEWRVNGQPVREDDLVFRLSGLAASHQGIIVETEPSATASRGTQALDYANRAGFSQVGLRTVAEDSGSSSSQTIR